MKIRTLLVDSSYLLKRSYHGAKDTYTSKFGHIGGLYSFITTVRKLIKDHMINKVVLAWDGEGGGILRHYIDNEYKANRKTKEWHKRIEMTAVEIRREKEKEESILKQRKRIQAYAEELFLRQIETDDVEGDDLIAAYCLQYNNKEEIFLYSADRDFAQLLDLNISMIIPGIDEPVNKTNYIMHFDHHYTNALVLKIICGDDTDNIDGIDGWGEKIILNHFPEMKFRHMTVREICRKADELNKARIAEKKKPLKIFEHLLNNVERLKINYQLVNLREPMLTDKAREELLQLEAPLSPEDRGSRNLYRMMKEDEFLTIYTGTFLNYVEPFYTVITNEQQLLAEYLKNNKGNL
jgi:5'-3' exonuclease